MIERVRFEISYLFKNTPWDTGISPGELANFLDTHPPGRALDLGCGTGTNAIAIANHGWETVGIDFSSIAIGRARRKARAASLEITFCQGDATKVDLIDGDFDLVLDIGCFHGLSIDSRKVYEVNLRRLLRPGGTFLLYTWLKMDEAEQSWSPTEQQIRNLFDRTLCTLQVENGLDKNGERSSAWFTLQKQAG